MAPALVVPEAAEQAVMIQVIPALLTLAAEAAIFTQPPSGAVLAAQELF